MKLKMNQPINEELLELERRDQEVRTRLIADGTLFAGYAGEMERVHLENADRLAAIVARYGWPGISLAGEDGCEAAWRIAQHAISRPDFQRRCLELIRAAVASGEAPPKHEAYLSDRIRFNERRPQVYGTIFDWDEAGEMSPWTIEDAANVDRRRTALGLEPLAKATARIQRESQAEANRPRESFAERQKEIERWARRVGWLPTPSL